MKFVIQNQNKYLFALPVALMMPAVILTLVTASFWVAVVSLLLVVLSFAVMFIPTSVRYDPEKLRISGIFIRKTVMLADIENIAFDRFSVRTRRGGTEKFVRIKIYTADGKCTELRDTAQVLYSAFEKKDENIPLYRLYILLTNRLGLQRTDE